MSTNSLTVAQAGVERASISTVGRLGAIAGIGFAVLFIAGLVLLTNSPEEDVADAELLAFYADSGNRLQAVAGVYLMAFAGILFLGFLAQLRAILSRSRLDGSPLVSLSTTAGAVFITMLFAGAAAIATVPVGMEMGAIAQPSADVTRVMPQLGYALLLLFSMFAASALIISISALALRSGVFPRWFGWLGIVCGLLLLLAVAFIPVVALPIWAIAASVVLLRQTSAA